MNPNPVNSLVEALEACKKALLSDPVAGPQKTIVGDDVIYHIDGQLVGSALNVARSALSAYRAQVSGGEGYVDIVFDGPPSHEAGRFVEVENSAGRSINFGEWVERPDGYWVLRIAYPLPAPSAPEGWEPKRIMQTEFGPRGNCQAACIAMMLGVPLSDIPNWYTVGGEGDDWWRAQREWLEARGLWLMTVVPHQGLPWPPRGFYIAGGVSPHEFRWQCWYRKYPYMGGWYPSAASEPSPDGSSPHQSGGK